MLGQAASPPAAAVRTPRPQALAEAGDTARGRTLYVTLEPCNHWGQHAALRRCGHPRRHRAASSSASSIPIRAPPARASAACALPASTSIVARPSRQRPAARGLPHPPAPRPSVRHRQARGFRRRHDRPPRRGERRRSPARWRSAGPTCQRATSRRGAGRRPTANIDNPQLTVRLPGLRGPAHPCASSSRARDRSIPTSTLFARRLGQPTAVIAPELTVRRRTASPSGPCPERTSPSFRDVLKVLGDQRHQPPLRRGRRGADRGAADRRLVDRFHLLTAPKVIGPEGMPATVRRSHRRAA